MTDYMISHGDVAPDGRCCVKFADLIMAEAEIERLKEAMQRRTDVLNLIRREARFSEAHDWIDQALAAKEQTDA